MDRKLRKRINSVIRLLEMDGCPDKADAVRDCVAALERRDKQLAMALHQNATLTAELEFALSDLMPREATNATKPEKVAPGPSSGETGGIEREKGAGNGE